MATTATAAAAAAQQRQQQRQQHRPQPHSDDSGSSTGARVSDGSNSSSHMQLRVICPQDVCLSAVNVNVSVDAKRETVPVYVITRDLTSTALSLALTLV